ncbi:MAG: cell division protein ZapA [Eubacteriaceae bacterium]|nr:cell division protein ZapA [Eubacteriaceae bacterium]
MADDRQRVTVNILGVDYQIISDDDPERVQKIASITDKLIKDTKLASPMLSTMGAAVLSALNLCEELYRAKEQVNSYRVKEDLYTDSEMTQQKLDRALARIDEEESINAILQSKYDQMADELADTQDMLDEYKDKFTALRTEYELNKRTLTELQSKFLENQIELVKARKTLLDFDDDK